MKQMQIVQAWDGILPDAVAEKRIRDVILSYADQKPKHAIRLRRFLILAAAFLVMVAAIGFRLHNPKKLAVTLDNGMNVVYDANIATAGNATYAYDYEIQTRELTAEELQQLLPCSLQPDSCHAVFRAETGEFERAETKIGEVHVHLAREGLPVTDTVVTGETANAEINGIPVTFGFFLTKPNSRGIRTAVLYASYLREGLQVYLETGGDEANREQLGTDLGNLVCELLAHDAPDLSEIRL